MVYNPFGLSKEHGYVILASTAIALQCNFSNIPAAKLRKALNIPYPDTGSGRHAAKLSDEDWEKFNSAQRVHQNYSEQLPVLQSVLLTSGYFYPVYASAASAVYLVGRFLYSYYYAAHGPSKRVYFVPFLYLPILTMAALSVHGGLKLSKFL